MKIAILSESEADQAAVHILVNALLGRTTELYDRPFRGRGWPAVLLQIPRVLNELHYNATDVDGLAIVADSDSDPPHRRQHVDPGPADPGCRYCQIWQAVEVARSRLKNTGRPAIRIAVGLAMPCIEAWLRCGQDSTVTEAAWLVALQEDRFPFDNLRLKAAVYGSERVSLAVETRRMVEEATRLASDVVVLEKWFPNGFGPFAADIRSWLSNNE
ncbi:MAG TPA: hypothetical protein VH120_16185 [Gemmataceae bacterium]|jgi:hypothetical protein|nr:hypothetical protein [Gemmataceae bacterium]